MALVGNGVRLSASNPMRQSGAASVGTQTAVRERTPGSVRNMFYGMAGERPGASQPNGYYTPYAWVLAPKSGSIRIYLDGAATLTQTAVPVVSLEVDMTATATLTQLAGLIVSGAVNMSAAATLTQAASGVASGSVTMSGAATLAIDGSGVALGTVAMTAAAALAIDATGIGSMTVDMQPYTELSPESLAAAVWSAVAASFNTTGSMGEKLNGAGSAGNPWTEVIETGMNAAQAMRLITAALAGELSGADTGTVTIRNAVADSADRITATVDGNGNRTAITYDLD
jgi:hypothetical protein